MVNLLATLILASEKAARIARSCVSNTQKDALLVAEKDISESNIRFNKDYKTVADVLVQETIKANIEKAFPELKNQVRGEESSEINGQVIVLKNFDHTVELLSQLIPPSAAKIMAAAAYSKNIVTCKDLPQDLPDLPLSDIGIWIDPIDATFEFIAGVRGEAEPGKGLICVTVLIGAYLISTGEPIIGVINQPFANEGQGNILWGISYNDYKRWGGTYDMNFHSPPNTLLISASENIEIVEKFNKADWEVKILPGAGNKLLKVALGEVSAYIVSTPTIFRWDTCAGHAILKAKGGEILTYNNRTPITYNTPLTASTKDNGNLDGIIAFSNDAIYQKLNEILNT